MSKTRGQSQVEFLRDVDADGGRIAKAGFSLNRDMWKDVSPTYYLTLDQKGVRSHQEFRWTPELEKYLLQAGVTAASPDEEAERFATILMNNLTRAEQDHGKDYARSVLVDILRGRPEYGLERLLDRIPAYRPSQSGRSFAACTQFLTTSIDGLQNEAQIALRYSPDQARDLMRAALEILLDETFLISSSDALFPRS
jgi:hypothetical protein